MHFIKTGSRRSCAGAANGPDCKSGERMLHVGSSPTATFGVGVRVDERDKRHPGSSVVDGHYYSGSERS